MIQLNKIIGTLLRGILNKWVIAGLAIMLGLAWYAGMPRGELRLAALRTITNGEDAALEGLLKSIFETSTALVDEAAEYHRTLSFVDNPQAYEITFPSIGAPEAADIEDFVDASLRTGGEAGQVSFSVDYKVLPLIRQSYTWFGRTNYFIVLRDAQPVDCPPSAVPADGELCLKLIAQYYPSKLPPSQFVGTADDLARDLAVLAMRGAIHNHDAEWAATNADNPDPSIRVPYLLAIDTPENMAALSAAAEGFEVLRLGDAHPGCASRRECLARAEALFRESFDATAPRVNSAAAFGLSLLAYDAAIRNARALQPVLEVETQLKTAEEMARLANQNGFFRAQADTPEMPSRFQLVGDGTIIPGDGLIDIARRFSCAMAEYRRGRWGECLDEIGDVEVFPPSLQPYAEAAYYDSLLYSEYVAGGSMPEFSALNQRVTGGGDAVSQLLEIVFLKHACLPGHSLGAAEIETIARRIVLSAPNDLVRKDAIITGYGCREGQGFPEDQQITSVIDTIETIPSEPHRLRYHLMLAQLFARNGDVDKALGFAKSALDLPWTAPFVRTAPEFERIRTAAGYEEYQISSFAPGKYDDVESCIIEEF